VRGGQDRPVENSFSGHERDHLFLGDGGDHFTDLWGASGLDSPADGRSCVLWDYDRDGWQDIALVNTNAPMLNLYRNEIAGRDTASDPSGGFVALRFVGGNRTAEPSTEFSARDGYGAKVTVELDDQTGVREHRCGEGRASQNSATMIVGIGRHRVARGLSVRWPSQKVNSIEEVPAGTLVTVFEDAGQSPSGTPFVIEPYCKPPRPDEPIAASRRNDVENTAAIDVTPNERLLSVSLPGGKERSTAPLRMFTTMATWCSACKRLLPQLRSLRDAFAPDDLEMYGVAVDDADNTADLKDYVTATKPAYEMLFELSRSDAAAVKRTVFDVLHTDAMPSSTVTDAEGRVLLVVGGAPSISHLKKLLHDGNARRDE